MTSKIRLLSALVTAALCGVVSAETPPTPTPNPAPKPAAPCRSIKSARLDKAAQAEAVRDVCEVTDSLGIFMDGGVKELTFPNLRYARFINIEADDLEAVNFPVLEKVDFLYIRTGDLRVAEFAKLKHVADTFFVKTRNLKFLHLPNLRTVNKMYLINNLSLEGIFVDKLYDIRMLEMKGNARLAPGTEALLKGVAYPLTEQEKKDIVDAEKKIRELKVKLAQDQKNAQAPLPPTGHPTTFNSLGAYYQSYPYYFYNYWQTIRPYGYHRYYFGWWW